MCETRNAKKLRTTEKGNLERIGLTQADAIDALVAIQRQLKEIATRSETWEMIQKSLQIHADSCDHARKGSVKEEANEFHLGGKVFKFEAKGKAGVVVGMVLGISATVLFIAAIPHVRAWISAWFGKGV